MQNRQIIRSLDLENLKGNITGLENCKSISAEQNDIKKNTELIE